MNSCKTESFINTYNVSISILRKIAKKVQKIAIPTFIFKDRSLAILETIVKFLKEKHTLTYHEIAVLINRDDRTIWTAYHRAKKKQKKPQKITKKPTKNIPTAIFKDRSVSVLEAVVRFLKEKHNLSYHEIAVLLNRDDRTIWTVYSRVKKKLQKNE